MLFRVGPNTGARGVHLGAEVMKKFMAKRAPKQVEVVANKTR